MERSTWFQCGCIVQRYLSFTQFLLLIFMMFSLKINALDIPLNDLLVWSQFHCFDVNICTSPLEYCNSYAKECRPCTEDICAERGGEDFPLQCNLNCSIADAKKKESEYDRTFQSFVTSYACLWFVLLVTMVPGSIVLTGCWCKKHSIIKRCKTAFKKTRRCKQIKAPTKEEFRPVPQEENIPTVHYCEKTLKGTCETNEDTQKTIATTQAKGLTSSHFKPLLQTDYATTVTEDNGYQIEHTIKDKQKTIATTQDNCLTSFMSPALQTDLVTTVTEEKDLDLTESKQADNTWSKLPLLTVTDSDGAVFNAAESNPDISSGFDSAPLKAAPSLDLKTLQETV